MADIGDEIQRSEEAWLRQAFEGISRRRRATEDLQLIRVVRALRDKSEELCLVVVNRLPTGKDKLLTLPRKTGRVLYVTVDSPVFQAMMRAKRTEEAGNAVEPFTVTAGKTSHTWEFLGILPPDENEPRRLAQQFGEAVAF
ncbi:MAG: hypothetical protein WC519_01370 [Parcubacteria group bacterium]